MELKITSFVTDSDPFNFSASAAELGQDAGKITWNNAKQEAADSPLLNTDDELDALRDFARGFGAWDKKEIANWTKDECNALLIQFISGDLREASSLCPGDGPGDIDWIAYEELAQEGTASGRIYLSGEDVYFYLGE